MSGEFHSCLSVNQVATCFLGCECDLVWLVVILIRLSYRRETNIHANKFWRSVKATHRSAAITIYNRACHRALIHLLVGMTQISYSNTTC